MTGKLAAATGLHCLLCVRGQLPFFCWGISCRWLKSVFYSTVLWSVVFIFFCCTFKQESVQYKQYLLRCHSSLRVSAVIMSWCGGPLCRLPVNVDSCMVVFTHVRIYTVSLHVSMTIARYAVCMCACVWDLECVNMSGCCRRPISWCISGKVSIHTPVCGPVTPAHHTITYGQTDSIALLIIETYWLTLTVRWPYGIMASLCQTVRRDSLALFQLTYYQLNKLVWITGYLAGCL